MIFVLQFFQWIIPITTTLFFLYLSCLPHALPGFSMVPPQITIMCIFYWSIYSPNSFPFIFIFAIGLLQDALFNLPFGFSALIFITISMGTIFFRYTFHKRTFIYFWLVFSVILLGVNVLTYLLLSILNGHLYSLETVIFQTIMTIGFFPFIVWVLNLTKFFFDRDHT